MALPLSAASLCSFAVGLVTTGFVGRLGQQELSVSVLGTSIFNVTGLSIVQVKGSKYRGCECYGCMALSP